MQVLPMEADDIIFYIAIDGQYTCRKNSELVVYLNMDCAYNREMEHSNTILLMTL